MNNLTYKRVNLVQHAAALTKAGIDSTPGRLLDALLSMDASQYVLNAKRAFEATPADERFNESMDYHTAIREYLLMEYEQQENDSDEVHMALADISDVYVGEK
jgi:hypothetical protein